MPARLGTSPLSPGNRVYCVWQLTLPSRFNTEINAIRRVNTQNGVYDVHTNQMHQPASMQPTHARVVQMTPEESAADTGSKVFAPLHPSVPRNFSVVDIVYESPAHGISPAVYKPDLDPDHFLAPFQGLSAVSDEIKDLLPPECRVAFDEALAREVAEKARIRGLEAEDSSRRPPVIDKDVVPYSKVH